MPLLQDLDRLLLSSDRRDQPGGVSRPSGKRLLVVEDNDYGRKTLTTLLQSEGYIVTSAANGREALWQLSGANLPNLIILDLVMPVMDGLEFCRWQRRDKRLVGIPVLVVTAENTVLPDPCLAPQVVGHLAKPVIFDELLARVRQCC